MSKQVIITEEMCNIVKNFFYNGMNREEIYLAMNKDISEATIRKIYKKLNLRKNLKNINDINSYDKDLLIKVKKLYEENKTYIEIEKILGIDYGIVRKYLNIQNFTRQHRRDNKKPIITQEILNLCKDFFEKKYSQNKIRDELEKLYPKYFWTLNHIHEIRNQICPYKYIKNIKDINCYDQELLVKVKNLFEQKIMNKDICKILSMSKDQLKLYMKIQNLSAKQRDKIDNKIMEINSKIRKSVSNSIRKCLASQKLKKDNKTFKAVGYTIQELKNHLESKFEYWMNFDNWGIYNRSTWDDNDSTTWVWNIDHIIPHSTFNYTSMTDEDFKKCWSLNNLRPLSAKQNVLDGVRRTRHKKI